MNSITDVAIVGAGPYGLSLAAQLRARGVNYRIFGRALDTWRAHMPKGMVLKSDGFASNLSAPARDSTLKAYCEKHNLAYGDQGLPVPLDTFLAYSGTFQMRFVPDLDEREVAAITRDADNFVLTLDDGERVFARKVVLAVGIRWFAHTPAVLAGLPKSALSHSFDHRDVERFRGRGVAVIGRGASAVDLAYALYEAGANVRIVARDPRSNTIPFPTPRPKACSIACCVRPRASAAAGNRTSAPRRRFCSIACPRT